MSRESKQTQDQIGWSSFDESGARFSLQTSSKWQCRLVYRDELLHAVKGQYCKETDSFDEMYWAGKPVKFLCCISFRLQKIATIQPSLLWYHDVAVLKNIPVWSFALNWLKQHLDCTFVVTSTKTNLHLVLVLVHKICFPACANWLLWVTANSFIWWHCVETCRRVALPYRDILNQVVTTGDCVLSIHERELGCCMAVEKIFCKLLRNDLQFIEQLAVCWNLQVRHFGLYIQVT